MGFVALGKAKTKMIDISHSERFGLVACDGKEGGALTFILSRQVIFNIKHTVKRSRSYRVYSVLSVGLVPCLAWPNEVLFASRSRVSRAGR